MKIATKIKKFNQLRDDIYRINRNCKCIYEIQKSFALNKKKSLSSELEEIFVFQYNK